ncbi:MAG: hypothetical protein ABH823_01670 [bacterium]
MKRFGILLFVVCCLLLISGCANTVTQIFEYGDEMQVTVALRGNFDATNNRYFLIIGSTENYSVPLPRPDLDPDIPELFEPGTTPVQGTEEAYYTNYFSTWAGYVILDDDLQYHLAKGPFVLGETITREVLSSVDEAATTLTFSFRLGRMFTAVPSDIYFDFFSVAWVDGQTKIPSDHLPSTGNEISKVSGSIVTVTDGEDSGLDSSLDILSLRAEIL